jgi:hypothetical protein
MNVAAASGLVIHFASEFLLDIRPDRRVVELSTTQNNFDDTLTLL